CKVFLNGFSTPAIIAFTCAAKVPVKARARRDVFFGATLTPSASTVISTEEWTGLVRVSFAPFTVSTPSAAETLTFAGTGIGFFARRDIRLPNIEQGLATCAHFASLSIGKNALRR